MLPSSVQNPSVDYQWISWLLTMVYKILQNPVPVSLPTLLVYNLHHSLWPNFHSFLQIHEAFSQPRAFEHRGLCFSPENVLAPFLPSYSDLTVTSSESLPWTFFFYQVFPQLSPCLHFCLLMFPSYECIHLYYCTSNLLPL